MQEAHYLNELICACASTLRSPTAEDGPEDREAQDAIEHAVLLSGQVKLTGYPAHDVFTIMGQYDALVENYRADVARNEAVLLQTYAESGLLEELNRSQPLAA